MRSYLHLLTLSCITASAGLFVTSAFADTTTTIDKTTVHTTVDTTVTDSALQLAPGIAAKDLNADKAIEKAFKGVTEDALSKNGFDNVVAFLADQDKDRIKKSTDKSLTNLDGADNKSLNDLVASLDEAYRNKYNEKMKIDYKAVFNARNLMILTGEVTDPNLLVGKWPVPVTVNANTAGAVTPNDAQQAQNKMFGGIVNLEKGRNVAIARLSGGGVGPLTASLIHETMTGWTFDIPNTIDAQRLYNNLVNNLSYLNNNRNTWPADAQQANVVFTQYVIGTLYDVDLSNAANHSPTAMNQ